MILNEYKLERLSGNWKQGIKGYGLGCLFGAVSFPGQDYYIIFGSAITIACAAWECTRPRLDREMIHEEQAEKTGSKLNSLPICSGFLTVNFLMLLSKIWLWSIPSWASAATSRLPSEQFAYGFWPLALAQSPIFNDLLLEKFKASSLPITETPFGSSGSLLILIGTLIAISTLRGQSARQSTELDKKVQQLLTTASIILIVSLSIALLCATSGGLGTLFATFVSPQLRALNRFMPYIYAPSVVVISLWLESYFNNLRQAHSSENNQ
ncbi:hypothetical protein [Cyanobium sp. L1E-Cus]|uniref:hypothetical protein n=1 Tax=Cyanobium sp. L1E-Cus TaxID=2823714 RepID=UPI0020CBCC34|nr:hypothetical protein [Cyanobium sp. L1E-Cus]MCP9822530.1 hypothetical protein [Cyanobium sp. L1E-Cus]